MPQLQISIRKLVNQVQKSGYKKQNLFNFMSYATQNNKTILEENCLDNILWHIIDNKSECDVMINADQIIAICQQFITNDAENRNDNKKDKEMKQEICSIIQRYTIKQFNSQANSSNSSPNDAASPARTTDLLRYFR